jgi:NAD(P)-dependent dehydrogenase (short-subunit alcohol dehydrogenase family)
MTTSQPAALVTGGAQGIGRAIAAALIRNGFAVMLADVNGEGAARTAAELGTPGARVASQAIDLRRVEAIPGMVERTVREVGRLDVLVNNAGVEFGGTFFEVTPEVWDAHLEVNLRAMFFTTQAATRYMKDHGGGAVVNIASVQGAIFSPRYIPYTVSKSGVRGLTSVLAVALAPHGIRVNAVAPGWCNTAMNKVAGEDGPDSPRFRERLRLIPLSRIGEPEDMAEAVVFLASPRAAYMTGQTITVDGGRTLGAPPT